jgi:hypothetical protein
MNFTWGLVNKMQVGGFLWAGMRHPCNSLLTREWEFGTATEAGTIRFPSQQDLREIIVVSKGLRGVCVKYKEVSATCI